MERANITTNEKVVLEGVAFKPPHTTKDIAILELAGLGRNYEHYLPHFASSLGHVYPLQLSNIPPRGTSIETIIDAVTTLDQTVRERFSTENIVYIGHSAAASAMILALKEHKRPVLGLLSLNIFPNFLEVYDGHQIEHTRTTNALSYMAKNRKRLPNFLRKKICPEELEANYTFEELEEDFILHLIQSTHDNAVHSISKNARKRFRKFCEHYGTFTQLEGNHSFNQDSESSTFNETTPQPLLNIAFSFMQEIEKLQLLQEARKRTA